MAQEASQSESMSFFDDDEGESLYSGFVLLDGVKIRVRELDAAEMAEHRAQEKVVAELLRDIAASDERDLDVRADEIVGKQNDLWDGIIALAVSGWELKRPDGTPVECTPETKKKLRRTKKAILVDKIIQRSALGRDMSGFLDES